MIDLMDRQDGCKVVRLWWDKDCNVVLISVNSSNLEEAEQESFAVEVLPERALDAFYHPYAYKKDLEYDCTKRQ